MMPSTAIDMHTEKPVGELTSRYLQKCGYSAAKIGSWTNKTRLLHDLGLCGDDIHDSFKILQDDFFVDISDFDFEKYFPNESSIDAFLISIRRMLMAVGLEKVVDRVYEKYKAFTLEMLESSISKKKVSL